MLALKFLLATLATAAIALSPFSSAPSTFDEKAKHARVMVFLTDGGKKELSLTINGEDHQFDVTTWEEGDSQTVTLEDGRDLVLRKEEHGLSLKIGDEDQIIISLGGNGHGHGRHVIEVDGEEGSHVMMEEAVGHSSTSSFTFVSSDGEDGEQVDHDVFVTSSGSGEAFSWVSQGGENKVIINGLNDLDADAKARLKDLLKEFAGEKEVVFAPDIKSMALGDHGANILLYSGDEDHGKVKVKVLRNSGKKHYIIKTKKKEDEDN